MHPIRKLLFKAGLRISYFYQRNYYAIYFFASWILIVILGSGILFLSYQLTGRYFWSEERVGRLEKDMQKAVADRDEVLSILSGKVAMIERVDGGNYAKIATVEWTPMILREPVLNNTTERK